MAIVNKITVSLSSIACSLVILLGVTFPMATNADSGVNINQDGSVTLSNILVMQRSSDTLFFCRAVWGTTFLRLLVLPHSTTTVMKSHGELGVLSDIKEGDSIDVQGVLASSNGDVKVDPTSIKDNSLLIAGKNLSGTVLSTDLQNQSFALKNSQFGTTTILVGTSTSLEKGARTIGLNDLSVGDKITSIQGSYDYQTNTLDASNIFVFQDPTVFVAHNFQGTLVSVDGAILPTSISAEVNGLTYTVYLPANTTVLQQNKQPTKFARFTKGDTIRFYGAVRPANLSEIDADTIRDLSF